MTEETKTPKPGAVPQEAKDHFGTAKDGLRRDLTQCSRPK